MYVLIIRTLGESRYDFDLPIITCYKFVSRYYALLKCFKDVEMRNFKTVLRLVTYLKKKSDQSRVFNRVDLLFRLL
jgi:hypothetical protein